MMKVSRPMRFYHQAMLLVNASTKIVEGMSVSSLVLEEVTASGNDNKKG